MTIELDAIKHKLLEDDDGEITLILKVNSQERLKAMAIPVKKLLNVKVEFD